MNLSTTYRRSEDVVAREIAGEMLLIPVKGDAVTDQRVFSLNSVGRMLWACLEQPKTLNELVSSVVEQFDVESGQAQDDVDDFLNQLSIRHLVDEQS